MSATALGVELVGRDLGLTRGDRVILSGVDVTVRGGERVALTGPSGSGKTTLMSLLAGLEVPDTGTVVLDGEPLVDLGATLRVRVGVVFQGYALVALLTASENIELALLAAGVPGTEAVCRAEESLAAVGLADRSDHLTEELSGGQQQRVAVARALATRPSVLLADEPTAEQDSVNRAVALDALLAAADTGAAVLIATHDVDLARRCDRWLHLVEGRLTETDGVS